MFGCEFRCHGYQWRTAPWCGAFSWTVSDFTSWASSVLASWWLSALFCSIIWTYNKLFLLQMSRFWTSLFYPLILYCAPHIWLAGWHDQILQKHNIYKKRLDPTGLILDAPKPDAINQPKVCALWWHVWIVLCYWNSPPYSTMLLMTLHSQTPTYKCYRGEEWLRKVLFMIKCPWWFVLRHVLYCTDHECIVCLVEMGFRLRNHYRSMVGGLSTMRHIVALVLVLKLWVLYPVICCCWIFWSCEFLLICVSFLFWASPELNEA